jgi:ATP-dependent RNA helicase SUPV3L1/SUV3
MRTEKWDGTQDVALPIPLIKQIAGRAGRFGLLKSKSPDGNAKNSSVAEIAASQPPGLVSALWPPSLDRVREAMETPNPTVRHARVDIANPNTEAGNLFCTASSVC